MLTRYLEAASRNNYDDETEVGEERDPPDRPDVSSSAEGSQELASAAAPPAAMPRRLSRSRTPPDCQLRTGPKEGLPAYTVAAVSADGDVSAQADLAILATAAGSTGGMAARHDVGAMPGMAGMPNATAEYMNVPRSATTAG